MRAYLSGRLSLRNLGVLLLLAALLLLSLPTAPDRADVFPDIKEEEVSQAVEILYAMGVVEGMDSGKYEPEQPLTRAQFSKLIVLDLDKGDELSLYRNKTLFSDVTSGHWAAAYVNLSSALGLVNGYGNGCFGPEDSIQYGQAVTVLLRALGYTTAQIGYYWPADYVQFAAQIGLDGGRGLSAYELVDRGDAAVLILAMLNSKTSNGQSLSPAGEVSTVSNAILLSHRTTSNDGTKGCALFYVPQTANGMTSYRLVYYPQNERLSSSLVGAEGTLYLDAEGYVSAFVPGDVEYTVAEGLLLSTDSRSPGGKRNCAAFYVDGELVYSPQVETLNSSLEGSFGYILWNENDYVFAFLQQQDADVEQAQISKAEEDALLTQSGRSYALEKNAVLLTFDGLSWEQEDWEDAWTEIPAGSSATLLFDGDELVLVALKETKERNF